MPRWPFRLVLFCALLTAALASIANAGVPRIVLAEHYGDCC